MKKISVIALSVLVCFSLLLSGTVFEPKVAANVTENDVNVNVDNNLPKVNEDIIETVVNPEYLSEMVAQTTALNVSVENGEDAGYIKASGNVYSATAYLGNKFLGWYKDGELISQNSIYNFNGITGNVVAKFKNNNVLASPGFEGLADGVISSTTTDTLFTIVDDDGWAKTTVVTDASNAYSGSKYLQMGIAWRTKSYLNLNGLEKNTYYKISFKYKAAPNKATSYRGIIVGPSTIETIDACRKNALGQNILNNSDTVALTDGVWYTEAIEFFTDNYNDVRVFFGLGGGSLIIDELTVFKADALDSDIKYAVNTTAENGKAYASKTSNIALNEEVILTAVGNANTTFNGWYEGANVVSSEINYVIKVNENKTLKAVFTENGTDNPYAKFDINGDGSVTEEDATKVLNHILQKETLLKDADFNNDGKVSVSDIVILRNNFYSGEATSSIKEEILAGKNRAFNAETLLSLGDSVPVANSLKAIESVNLNVISPDLSFANAVSEYLEETTGQTVFCHEYTKENITSADISLDEMAGISGELFIVDLSLFDTAENNKAFEKLLRVLKENNCAIIAVNSASETATNKEAQIPVEVFYNIPVIDIDRAVKSTSAISFSDYETNKSSIIANAIINYLSIVNEDKANMLSIAKRMPMQFYYGNDNHVLNDYSEKTNNLVYIKDAVLLNGRTYWNEETLGADWIGSGFTVSGNFSGDFKVTLSVTGDSANIYAIVDNNLYNPNNIILDSNSGTFTICNLTPGVHTVQLFKATEPRLGTMTIESITYNGILYRKPAEKPLKIQVYGDSITSGCALLKPEQEPNDFISQDGYKSYGNKTAMAFNADVSIMSRSGASVMSAKDNLIQEFCYNEKYGVEGEWDYANNQADIVIVGLGTNDLDAIQNNPDGLKEEIKKMLAKLRAYNPNAHIIWVYGMMQTGKPEIFSGAVAEMNDDMMHYVFLPRNADGGGGHPTNEGQRNATSTLVEYIRDNIL